MPIKILHLADIHYCRKYREQALTSLDWVILQATENPPDIIALAGDLADNAVWNTDEAGFPELEKRIKNLLDIAPVVTVYGTVTHDIPGSLEVFQDIKAKHGFTILQPGKQYFLSCNTVTEMFPYNDRECLLILGCPEPQKTWFLRDKSMSQDETNATINQKMRELLLGYGAIRQQYKDLPCLFVYHGRVTGATTCNGHVLPPSIEIGLDDLGLIDQNITAEYAGSAYPINWGELDQKSFLRAELEPGHTYAALGHIHLSQTIYASGLFPPTIWKKAYPHPPMKKIVSKWSDADDPLSEEIKGFRVWQEYQATAEEETGIDKAAILQKMLAYGAVEGSKVTIDRIHAETLRAAEIKEAHTLPEKINVYYENSAENTIDIESVLKKAVDIEGKAHEDGLTGGGLWFRLDGLRLRGAIGIKKGTGLDEITINLREFDSGLITLTGKNGKGKTTLIENMHFYLCMLTRSGKLQDHFFLRDSIREAWGVDIRTGDTYRALMQIDGQNESGKIEACLYKNDQPITNGKLDDYKKKIDELFGSMELFLRSAFVAQKNTAKSPSLAEATKGEKKALFVELAGIDFLQTYSDMGKKEVETTASRLSESTIRRDTMTATRDGLKKLESEKTGLVAESNLITETLEDAMRDKENIESSRSSIEKKLEVNRELEKRIVLYRQVLENKEESKKILETGIAKLETALKEKPEAEKIVAEFDQLDAKNRQFLNEKTQILTKIQQISAKYAQKKQFLDDQGKDITASIAKMEANILKYQSDFLHSQEKLDQNVICPNCVCFFSPLLENERISIASEMACLKTSCTNCEKKLKNLHATQNQIQAQIDELVKIYLPQMTDLENKKAKNEQEQKKIEVELMNWTKEKIEKVKDARYIIAYCKNAEAELEEKRILEKQIIKDIDDAKEQIIELELSYESGIEQQYSKIKSLLDCCQIAITDQKTELARVETELKYKESEIVKCIKDLQEAEKLEKQIKADQKEFAEWSWLQRACGPDGIQALELDALAPSIEELINRLLPQDTAVNRYTKAKIETTRFAGKGKKTHQIEDFQIYFFDALAEDGQKGQWTALDNLSGGEGIHAIRAVYGAFEIIRAKNTNSRFLTCFQDEADGALDPEARIEYLKALEIAHNESGRHHTILITHSPELQQMISQKIVMSELGQPSEAKAMVTG